MLNFRTTIKMYSDKPRKLLGILLFIFILGSCAQETDIDVVNPEIKTTFDERLSEVLDLMEENPEQAIKQLDQTIVKAEEVDSKFYSGKAKWYKGYIYHMVLEDVQNAYITYNQALRDVLQTDDSSLKMNIYNNLGILFRFYSQYDAAINNYEAALQLKEDLTNEQLSDLYYNYGVALKLKGDSVSFFEAEKAFTQSLDFAEQIDYHENMARVHNQIGLMYKSMKQYDVSRIAYNNTIDTYINNPELHEKVGKAYHGIGVTYMDEGNTGAAIRAFNKALEYKSNSGSIFLTKYDLGTVLMRDGKTSDAINTWKDALSEKHNKNSIEQIRIYADLTKILKQNNQLSEALEYSEIYHANVQNILAEGETYKSKNDQVLFANIIKEYEEFNRPTPFFSKPWAIVLTLLAITLFVYLLVALYYRSKSKKKVSEVVSKIQTEFMDIKLD